MTSIMLGLIVSALAWMPTVDGQRVEFGYQEPSYWLGVSIPPWESNLTIEAILDNESLFTHTVGTEFQLAYIDSYSPIYFYENGEYKGAIVPEPSTITLFMLGLLGIKKAARRNPAAFGGGR